MIQIVKLSNVTGEETVKEVFHGDLDSCSEFMAKIYIIEKKNPLTFRVTRGFTSMTSTYDDGIYTRWYMQEI